MGKYFACGLSYKKTERKLHQGVLKEARECREKAAQKVCVEIDSEHRYVRDGIQKMALKDIFNQHHRRVLTTPFCKSSSVVAYQKLYS
jgi:hypothetical protein